MQVASICCSATVNHRFRKAQMGFRLWRGDARRNQRDRRDRRATGRTTRDERTVPYVPGVRAVLFDLDNTLISHTRDLAVVALAFLQARVEPSSRQRRVRYRMSLRALVARLLGAGIMRIAVLTRGARSVLPLLDQAGIRFGILTNGSSYKRVTVRASGLGHRAHCVVVSTDYGTRKPDDDIFCHAARRLGVSPREVLMVGDKRRSDIKGAHQAGMRTAWLRRGFSQLLRKRLPEATVTIESLTQLRQVLGLGNSRGAQGRQTRRSA